MISTFTSKLVFLRSFRTIIKSIALTLTLCGLTPTVFANDFLNRNLLDAIENKDLLKIELELENGANPEAVVGIRGDESAICLAIDDRESKMLELLLRYGASPNAFSPIGRYKYRSPISCAISHYNPEAFNLLIRRGANVDVDLCPECNSTATNSPFLIALFQGKYNMALEIAKNTDLDNDELRKLRSVLENTPYDVRHPWSKARDDLLKIYTDTGKPIEPIAPHTPNGDFDRWECVFSPRDMAEGLERGTVCHDSP